MGPPLWFSGKASACHYRSKGLTPGLRRTHKLWSDLGPVPQVLSPCPGVREPQLCCNYRSLRAQLSVLHSNRSHCNERSTHPYRRAAPAPRKQRKARGATNPAQPKINKLKKKTNKTKLVTSRNRTGRQEWKQYDASYSYSSSSERRHAAVTARGWTVINCWDQTRFSSRIKTLGFCIPNT